MSIGSAHNKCTIPSGEKVDFDICANEFAREAINNELLGELAWLDLSPLGMCWDEYMDLLLDRREKVSLHKRLADDIYKGIIPREIFLGDRYNLWRHQVLVEDKIKLLDEIFKSELFASGHYRTVANFFTDTRFPNSDHLYSRVVNLFNDFYVNENQMIEVARIVRQHVHC